MWISRQNKGGKPQLQQITVHIWYLQMCDPADFNPKWNDDPRLDVRQSEELCPELNRFLYCAVGGKWNWIDRLGWT